MSFPSKSIVELRRIEEKENIRPIIPVISMKKYTQQKECVFYQQPGLDASRNCVMGSKRNVEPILGPQVFSRDLSDDNMPVNRDSNQQNVVLHPVAKRVKRKVLFKDGKRIKRSRPNV